MNSGFAEARYTHGTHTISKCNYAIMQCRMMRDCGDILQADILDDDVTEGPEHARALVSTEKKITKKTFNFFGLYFSRRSRHVFPDVTDSPARQQHCL